MDSFERITAFWAEDFVHFNGLKAVLDLKIPYIKLVFALSPGRLIEFS